LLDRIQTNGLVTREKIRQEIRPQENKPVITQVKTEPKIEQTEAPKIHSVVPINPIVNKPVNNSAELERLQAEQAKIELTKLINSPLPNAPTRLSTENKQSTFIYVPTSHDFKIEINFQKKDKYSLDDVIEALRKTLNYWEQTK
jgi:hypothetical protein